MNPGNPPALATDNPFATSTSFLQAAASTTTSSTASASATDSGTAFGYGSSTNSSSSGSFYRNLFYILIALLVAFGVVSTLSWLRTRHRRILIYHEAQRLNLLVPGMPGYAAERERVLLLMSGSAPRKAGDAGPLLWDVRDGEREKWALEEKEKRDALEREKGKGVEEMGEAEALEMRQAEEAAKEEMRYEPDANGLALNPVLGSANLIPLSAKPVVPDISASLPPIPVSSLTFFPQDHALRRPPSDVTTDSVIETWEASERDQAHEAGGQGSPTDGAYPPRPYPADEPGRRPPGTVAEGKKKAPDQGAGSLAAKEKEELEKEMREKKAVEVTFVIRMPVPAATKAAAKQPRVGIVPGTGEVYEEDMEDDSETAIMDEWQGAEFGTMEIPVWIDSATAQPGGYGTHGEGR